MFSLLLLFVGLFIAMPLTCRGGLSNLVCFGGLVRLVGYACWVWWCFAFGCFAVGFGSVVL